MIILEGMTASGKTTAADLLSKKLGLSLVDEVFRDPYDLLHKFHNDTKWAFPMQMQFITTRYVQYLCAHEDGQDIIMDRSLFGDRVYASLYYSLGYFSKVQYEAYLKLWDALAVSIAQPKVLIILSCTFNTSWERIKQRGREDEIAAREGYWRNLHVAYENFEQKMTSGSGLKILKINTDEVNLLNDEPAKNRFTEQVASYL